MNVLGQVAALFRVSFISPREPFDGRAEFIDRIPVQVILTRLPGRNGLIPPLLKVVVRDGSF
jgi:hypothetical protein